MSNQFWLRLPQDNQLLEAVCDAQPQALLDYSSATVLEHSHECLTRDSTMQSLIYTVDAKQPTTST